MTSFHEVQSICPYCAEGCGFYTIVEQGKASNIEYMKKHPVNEGGLCLKGNAVLDIIYHPNRIYSPLTKKDDGTFNNISWDEAINVIVSNFQKIAKKYGPDSLSFLTSANCTN
ncbi:MAG: molybdopterin-dependent oxidoreductase, partial [Deltaproteobacteria bacterium]|nr:molybdopterin-dependent oxidoreductase [Deltaproteobacteria bacterium]